MSKVLKSIDKQSTLLNADEKVTSWFLYLSKVCGSMKYTVQFLKGKDLNIKGTFLNGINSYIWNRSQHVEIQHKCHNDIPKNLTNVNPIS